MENQYDIIVNTILKFYTNTQLANYKLPLVTTTKKRGKGGKEIGKGPNASVKSKQLEIMDNIRTIKINNVFSYIPGRESLEEILKKAITFKFIENPQKSKNEKKELENVIEVLQKQINIITDENLFEKKRKELNFLKEKMAEFSMSSTEEQNENEIALKALKILSKNDNNSKSLYIDIREKLLPNVQFNFDEHVKNHANYDYREKYQQQNKTLPKEQKEDVYVPPHIRNIQITYGDRKNTETNDDSQPGLFTKLAETHERLCDHSGYTYANKNTRFIDDTKREKQQYYNEIGKYYIKNKNKEDNYVSINEISKKTQNHIVSDDIQYPILSTEHKIEKKPVLSNWINLVKSNTNNNIDINNEQLSTQKTISSQEWTLENDLM